MDNKKNKRHVTMRNILLFALITIICLGTGSNCLAETYYDNTGFYSGDEQRVAEKSVIMRVGCNQCYINNRRISFEVFPENIMPFEENGMIYIPLKTALDGLGAENTAETESGVSAKIGEKEYKFCETSPDLRIIRRNGMFFAESENVAALTKRYYKRYKDTVIISADESIDRISEATAESLHNALDYNWQNVYLGSLGYVTDVVVHPKNRELIYCRTDVGGIYLLDREKNKWKPLMDGISDADREAQPVRAFALDPNNDNVIYVSSGSTWWKSPSCIMKTTDRGNSWRKLDFKGNTSNSTLNRLVGENIAVDPNDSNTVYAGTFNTGLFVSYDAGETWDNISSVPTESSDLQPGGIADVVIDDSVKLANGRSATVYVAVWGRGMYESHDGGVSFKHMNGSPTFPCRMQVLGDKIYITATTDNSSHTIPGGFFCYENGKFTDLSPDDGRKWYMAFMINRENPDMMIICKASYVDSCDILRTYDGGKTWENLGAVLNPTGICQDPIDPNGIWWPHGKGIYYIPNMHEKRFSHIDADYNVEELVVTGVTSVPSKEAPVLLSDVMDHGNLISENINVKAKSAGYNVTKGTATDYCSEDPSMVVRVGFTMNDPSGESIVTVSEDYGRTSKMTSWDIENVITDLVVGAEKQENGYPVIMVVAYGKRNTSDRPGKGLWRSKDFGKTWEKCADIVTENENWNYTYRMLAADKVNPNVFYFTEKTSLYRSMNGGDTWNKIYTLPVDLSNGDYSGYYIKTIPNVPGGLWIRSSQKIYATLDYGKTIETINNVKNVTVFGFGKGKDGSTLPAAYVWGEVDGVFGLYVSDDLGRKWRKLNDSTHNIPILFDMCGDMNIYGRAFIATTGRGVICLNPVGIDEKIPSINMDTKSSEPNPISKNYAVGTENTVIQGSVSEYCEVRINGQRVKVDGDNNFSFTARLNEGENNFLIEAADAAGNHAQPEKLMIRHVKGFLSGEDDTEPPKLTVESVPESTTQRLYTLRGKVNEPGEIMVNRLPITLNEDLSFFSIIELNEGENTIRVQARDHARNACRVQEYKISYAPDTTKVTDRFESKYKCDGFEFNGDISKYGEFTKTLDKVAFGNVSVAAAFETMWDEDYLYVAAKVVDDIVYNGNSTSHQNDCIEIYMDGDNCKGKSYNDHDKQYVFVFDASGTKKNAIFTRTMDGYTAEIRIPWSDLGVTPSENMKVGFDIDCVDNDSQYVSDGVRKGAIVWNGTMDNWCNPAVFSTIILKK